MRAIAGWVITACWVTFGIVWVVAAFTARTTARGLGGWRRWWYLVFVALFVLITWQMPAARMNAILWSVGWPIATIAGVVTIVGVVIAIWSRVTLGVYWSGNVVVKEGHVIVERGPYRLVRHPIYLGVLLMLFGTALLWGVGGGIALFCMAFAGLGAKAFLEERLLGECFPAEYGAYKARVKHALVPWLL